MELVRLSDYTPRERAALIAVDIVADERVMTTAEIAERLEMTWHGARDLMNDISRVISVRCTDGYWHKTRDM